MPARAMTYKFLNTFIDDLFAFTIKMPTLHRLATLRDDVIFFVYLYQSWKYTVDYSRVNEFGQGGEEGEGGGKGEGVVGDVGVDTAVRAKVEARMTGAVKATGAEKAKAVKRR